MSIFDLTHNKLMAIQPHFNKGDDPDSYTKENNDYYSLRKTMFGE